LRAKDLEIKKSKEEKTKAEELLKDMKVHYPSFYLFISLSFSKMLIFLEKLYFLSY